MNRGSIAVAGGGIAGLSAALALAGTGRSVSVYERAPQFSEVGAGVQLGPNACRALKALGLLDQVSAVATEPERLVIHRGRDGAALVDLPIRALAAQRWGAPSLVIHRGDLHAVLLEAARAHPRIAIHNDARLIDIQDEGEGVTLHLAMAGVTESRLHYALVAADGVGSQLRASFDGGRGLRNSGRVAWRTLVQAGDAPSFARAAVTHLWLGPRSHLVHYPLRGGSVINVVAITGAMAGTMNADDYDAGDDSAAHAQHLARAFASFASNARKLMEAAPGWRMWPLLDAAPLASFAQGRVALAGDAAHPMVPFLAQGASQALEDANALAISFSQFPGNPAAAMAAYSRARVTRANRVQASSHRQAMIYHASGLTALARDLAIQTLGPSGMARSLHWLYRGDD